jgi:hypothetical protein
MVDICYLRQHTHGSTNTNSVHQFTKNYTQHKFHPKRNHPHILLVNIGKQIKKGLEENINK